jgi:hypothetical protein
MSNKLATTIWLHKQFNFTKVILSSIYQIPRLDNDLSALVKAMPNVEFHFAIEGLKGAGKDFLYSACEELKIFDRFDSIDTRRTNWLELHDLN